MLYVSHEIPRTSTSNEDHTSVAMTKARWRSHMEKQRAWGRGRERERERERGRERERSDREFLSKEAQYNLSCKWRAGGFQERGREREGENPVIPERAMEDRKRLEEEKELQYLSWVTLTNIYFCVAGTDTKVQKHNYFHVAVLHAQCLTKPAVGQRPRWIPSATAVSAEKHIVLCFCSNFCWCPKCCLFYSKAISTYIYVFT